MYIHTCNIMYGELRVQHQMHFSIIVITLCYVFALSLDALTLRRKVITYYSYLSRLIEIAIASYSYCFGSTGIIIAGYSYRSIARK